MIIVLNVSLWKFNFFFCMTPQAFETTFHPLGQLMESLVDVFRAAYIGVGAHPRLLKHAVQEVNSYVRRIFMVLR
jgi:amyotrophic lateral sclerosis 2 protein